MPRSRHSTTPPASVNENSGGGWPTPFWATGDGRSVRYYLGDVRAVLARLPAESVQCVVTSPPYWGLRSYATGDDKHLEIGAEPSPDCDTKGRARCGRCYVCNLVDVFRGVRRVLREDGVAWLNLGDTFASGTVGRNDDSSLKKASAASGRRPNAGQWDCSYDGGTNGVRSYGSGTTGLPPGNLVGVPWRVVLALQADGWVLRQDVIWAKPAPMPESVTDRCTKAHEYVFLLAKGPMYFYDNEAIKEPTLMPGTTRSRVKQPAYPPGAGPHKQLDSLPDSDSRNKRSVWTVSHGGGYSGLHFAVFPPALVEPMILAGTSERGACPDCGTPWRRVVGKERKPTRPGRNTKVTARGAKSPTIGTSGEYSGDGRAQFRLSSEVTGNRDPERHCTVTETIGWEPGCGCGRSDVVPCVVLDPFLGSGTVAEVCLKAGRACVGIDLSAEYLTENAVPRAVEAILGDYRIEERVGGFPNPGRWRRIVEARRLTSSD